MIYSSIAPFELCLFNNGGPEGPELLLKTLRGEEIDWDAMTAKYAPSAFCQFCGFTCLKQDFTLGQLSRKDCLRCCKQCVGEKEVAGTPYECFQCHLWKVADAFCSADLHRYIHRVCTDCDEKRDSKTCNESRRQAEYIARDWVEVGKPSSDLGVC